MPMIQLPDATYHHLAAEAVAHQLSLEEWLVQRLTSSPVPPSTVEQPLTGAAWQQAFEAFNREIVATAHQYPPGFRVDDSRDAIYDEQLNHIR
jgi:hypothetical protein